jgi:hypothetical protein
MKAVVRSVSVRALAVVSMLVAIPAGPIVGEAPSEPLSELMRRRVENAGLQVDGRDLVAQRALPAVYERRHYAPLWL